MCDLNCVNLIDLSLEEEISVSTAKILEDCEELAKVNALPSIPALYYTHECLENNPFDGVQKLADRLDDPFDMVEKEACLKAGQAFKVSADVKLGNLLSLSDDNILEERQKQSTTLQATDNLKDLDLESPPIAFNDKQPPDSASGPDTDSGPNSSAENSSSAKLKRNMEYRKRLLKLSISNASFSSPTIRKQSLCYDDMSTPVSSMLFKAAEFGENLLAAESPLKLVEDEELISEEAANFVDSEKNFEADLEMLSIPILNELPSPDVGEISIKSCDDSPKVKSPSKSLESSLPTLEEIKAKIEAKKGASNNTQQQEISSLIQNLKYLISSGEMVDNNKRQQASDMLESLSMALKPSNIEDSVKPTCVLAAQPLTITRQTTFDMDLQEKSETNADSEPLIQSLPSCMVSSSVTYDGETPDEKQDLNLPEISPPNSPTFYPNKKNNGCENQLHTDVSDIMEQLSQLLINNTDDTQTNCSNPTFIVVMNTNQLNNSNINYSNLNAANAKVKSKFATNYLENSISDFSPESINHNSCPRRRSQSLSIHDKVKIVQLPLNSTTPRSTKKKNTRLDESLPITTTPPSNHKQTTEYKTPSRLRRNSYSSGTPYTAQVRMRRTGFESENRNSTQVRRTQTLDTHHEGQQKAIVRPMSMPSNMLLPFKPDLKKKTKQNTVSIIKSSVPLKATIPVKKVAPILKTSPPTPETNSKSKLNRAPTTPLLIKGRSSLDGEVEYPSACSTPDVYTSPFKRTVGSISKTRYSYMSVTPTSKPSVPSCATTAGLKRRTITEFKANSPLKSRPGNPGLSSSRVSAGNSKLSSSAGSRISKTSVITGTANTATIKPTRRLSSLVPVGSSFSSERNKENKRP